MTTEIEAKQEKSDVIETKGGDRCKQKQDIPREKQTVFTKLLHGTHELL